MCHIYTMIQVICDTSEWSNLRPEFAGMKFDHMYKYKLDSRHDKDIYELKNRQAPWESEKDVMQLDVWVKDGYLTRIYCYTMIQKQDGSGLTIKDIFVWNVARDGLSPFVFYDDTGTMMF